MNKFIQPMVFTSLGVILGLSGIYIQKAFVSEAQAAQGGHFCKVDGGNNDAVEDAATKLLNNGYKILGFSTYFFPNDPYTIYRAVLACK
jgi:hypothetical protein